MTDVTAGKYKHVHFLIHLQIFYKLQIESKSSKVQNKIVHES